MSRDYESIPGGQSKSGQGRMIAILIALAFVGGAIASGWVLSRYDLFGARIAPAPSQPASTGKPKLTTPSAATQTLPDPLAPDAERALARRVGDLEDRLSRINVQAQAASGNAARAEGLLIAFAARRALDRGSELGYLEGQLLLRFGQAQPNAVRTIINASRDPVTVSQLRRMLEEDGPKLTLTPASQEGFWSGLQREASELFVLRKSGTPSPAPEQRLNRATRYLESGRVDAALAEVQRLPGKSRAKPWIELAERYIAAQQALDIIETAAILEPRALRDVEGQPVEQPSPLAPDGALNAGGFLILPGLR